jgi:hypothetical protein
MELVARDMKAMGVYISRSLSYDGVEQTPDRRVVFSAPEGNLRRAGACVAGRPEGM